MFTGIITGIGTVEAARETGGELTLTIVSDFENPQFELGESIACSGVCLTVVAAENHRFTVQLSQETVRLTARHVWHVGAKLNLERALRAGDRLGGHIVSGHVDGLANILSITPVGGSHELVLEAPAHLAKYIAAKGSVTLDGVSLTVNEVGVGVRGKEAEPALSAASWGEQQASTGGNLFKVNIIPHTWEVTTLGARKAGDSVNLEIDMIARYVERLMIR